LLGLPSQPSPSRGARLTAQTRSSNTALALVVSSEDWQARALSSVLEPAGYRVLRVATGAEALKLASAERPDLLVIGAQLSDVSGEALCGALRQAPATTPNTPIIGVAGMAVTREDRLRWLRAGAWDCFGFPLDAEELVLKLGAYIRGKQAADGARAGALVDRATGLYNGRGLKRRARELVAQALRLHAALACVAFGIDPWPEGRGTEARPAGRGAIRSQLGRLLRTHARLSDTVGWGKQTDFVVLAPATNPDGAERLAQRLAQAIEATPPQPDAALPAFEVRAGYDAVSDVHATPLEAEELLERAGMALALARSAGRGARIKRFEAEH